MRRVAIGLVLSGCATSTARTGARASIERSQEAASRDTASAQSVSSTTAATDAATNIVTRAPREPVFAEALFRPSAGSRGAGGRAVPRAWFHERPELDDAWPRGDCSAGRETWMNDGDTTSIVRTAYCSAAARDLHSTNPSMEALLRTVSASVAAHDAHDAHDADAGVSARDYGFTERFESSTLRIVVNEQRWCIGHNCRSVSDPGVEITIVTMRHPAAWFASAYTRAFSLTNATRGLEGVSVGSTGRRMFVTYEPRPGNGRTITIVYALAPASQESMRRWLIDRRFATVTPNIAWQIDATRPGLSYITIPPERAEGVGQIQGIADENEPFVTE